MLVERNSTSHYRTDIDGLRALAVLPVVLFHVGLGPIARGGFVGVDIFFAISGYLITRIIFSQISERSFSFTAFYHRRVRRILPATIPVYAVSMILIACLFYPDEQRTAYRSIASAIAFSSNIFFYYNVGYFDEAAHLSPVLHTWSLAVEEQFYFVIPILLVFVSFAAPIAHFRRYALLSLTTLAIASLFVSEWLVRRDASAAFYMIQSRAWELSAGGLVGLLAKDRDHPAWALESLAAGGLALIVWSVLTFSPAAQFPGLAALPPVLGALLIIYAGAGKRRSMVYEILSLRPLRLVGLASYSIYLWHWPLIVFYPFLFYDHGVAGRLGLFLASLAFGFASWAFIERPLRTAPALATPRQAFRSIGVTLVGLLIASLAAPAIVTAALPIPERTLAILGQKSDPGRSWREGKCFLTSNSDDVASFDEELCLRGSASKENVLLVGDSHAAQYYPALARDSRVNVLQATASGCRPTSVTGEARCTALMDRIWRKLQGRQLATSTILLAARWKRSDALPLRTLVKQLRTYGYRVVVLGPVVEYTQALPRLLASQSINSKVDPSRYRVQEIADVDTNLGQSVAVGGGRYISVAKAICQETCEYWATPNRVMQFDYGHLTPQGAARVVKATGLIDLILAPKPAESGQKR